MIVRRKKIKYFKNVRIIVVRVDQRHKNTEGGGEGRGAKVLQTEHTDPPTKRVLEKFAPKNEKYSSHIKEWQKFGPMIETNVENNFVDG